MLTEVLQEPPRWTELWFRQLFHQGMQGLPIFHEPVLLDHGWCRSARDGLTWPNRSKPAWDDRRREDVVMEIREIEPFLDYWDKVRGRTLRVARCTPPERLEWSFREGRWTIGELLRHLGAIERFMFAENVQEIGRASCRERV